LFLFSVYYNFYGQILDRIKIIVIMAPIMIDDLSQIGRPALARGHAARASAGKYDTLAQGFERGEEEQKDFRSGGQRNPLIRLNSDKEIHGFSFDCLWPGLAGFGQGLARFG
jgi:hypothetical protein